MAHPRVDGSWSLDDRIDDLVSANHILASQGVLDAFGHVSVREPGGARFLLARSMAPSLVAGADILTFDLNGQECLGDMRQPYLERFIHSAIYTNRSDVQAIVHSHSASVIPFSVVKSQPLRPVYHMAGFLSSEVPVFDIRDVADRETDLLIRNSALGCGLADSLGEASVVLMRGPGLTVVAGTLRQAVFRAVYTEVNARIQAAALRLGDVCYLNPAEARAAAAVNDGQIDRAWELWLART